MEQLHSNTHHFLAFAKTARYGVPINSLEWKPRKFCFLFHYWPIAIRFTPYVRHVGEWLGWKCCKMEAEVQPHRYFVLQVKCPSLLTDATKPTTFLGLPREWQEWCFRKMGAEIQQRRYFILQVQCPSLSKDCKKTYTVLWHGQRVQSEKSEVNCWNGRRITDLSMCKENILYSKS